MVTFGELQQLRRALFQPSDIRYQVGQGQSNFRNETAANQSPLWRLPITRYLDRWLQDEIDQITWISQRTEAKRLSVFSPSRTRTTLKLVRGSSAGGYDLDSHNSIAGCALQNDILVYWHGHIDSTDYITAWNLDGDVVGTYDFTE